ncbi:SDR family oxidoreductase [Chitinilyticum piscinae]|uniref:SDR family oxidoreductase n=1 Tax=Chitinilyticum piscinae TaxID=2866724 RepID=A0A8J7FMB1_9NEIS|nr:SDR family oxidoreductase [Chitinilyticum piscinae]MBE9608849.1 SDR family oxidoreductase [Chitinilyticum piscinae]
MQTVLITGAGRGLGLEFVRQYLADGWRVIAARRAPSQGLDECQHRYPELLQQLVLDVSEPAQIDRLPALLDTCGGIDLLINNAGIYGGIHQQLSDLDPAEFLHVMAVNALAPLRVTQAVLTHLHPGAAIAHVTSLMGSMADNGSGGDYAYRASKAALNAVGKSMAVDLAERHPVVLLHPGWVQTDMGGPAALIDASTSVSGMRAVIARLHHGDSGRFFRYDGTELPW